MEDFAQAIEINPYHSRYYFLQAAVAIPAKDLVVASRDMAILNDLFPDSIETVHLMAQFEIARGHFQDALECYDRLIGKEQSNALFYMERGQVSMIIRSYFNADEDFGMALDLNPKMMEAYVLKGKALLELSDTAGACNNFRMARQMGSAEATQLFYKHCKEDE